MELLIVHKSVLQLLLPHPGPGARVVPSLVVGGQSRSHTRCVSLYLRVRGNVTADHVE